MSRFETANKNFREFKQLDRELRSCQLAIETAKEESTQKAITQEKAHFENALQARVAETAAELREVEAKTDTLKKVIEKIKSDLKRLKQLVAAKKEEKDQIMTSVAKKEGAIDALAKDVEEINSKQAELANIETAEAALEAAEKQKEEVKREYVKLKQQEKDQTKKLAELQNHREQLLNRQAAIKEFGGDKAKRDEFLTKKIKGLKKLKREQSDQMEQLQTTLSEDEKMLKQKKTDLVEETLELTLSREKYQEYKKKKEEIVSKFNELKTRRADTLREVSLKEIEYERKKSELSKSENSLSMPPSVKAGYKSMLMILDRLRKEKEEGQSQDNGGSESNAEGLLNSYYGLLIDHVNPLKDSYSIAVEVIAGSKLWHFVVDNSSIATEFLKIQKQMRLPGEMNFLTIKEISSYPDKGNPLDRSWLSKKLHRRESSAFGVSGGLERYVIPAMELIEENQVGVQPILDFVFGQNLICKATDSNTDLEICCEVRSLVQKQCVTMEGEKIEKKGAMTGGYRDLRRSKVNIWKNHQAVATAEWDAARDLKEALVNLKAVEDELASCSNRIEKAKVAYDRRRRHLELMTSTEAQGQKEIKSIEAALVGKQQSLEQTKASLQELDSKLSEYEEELGRDMSSQLTSEEESELSGVLNDIHNIEGPLPKGEEATLAKIRSSLLTTEKIMNDKEILHENQKRTLAALVKTRQEALENDQVVKDCQVKMDQLKKDVNKEKLVLANIEKELAGHYALLDTHRTELPQQREQFSALEKLITSALNAWKDAQDACKKSADKQKQLEIKQKESQDLVAKLSLDFPRNEDRGKYKGQKFEKLEKLLAKLTLQQKQLSFDPVMLTKYQDLEKEQKSLQKKKSDYDARRIRLEGLLDFLENKKKEAVENTFLR
jgi:structural maintenance of chromosome 3 (chondroitin sulfate proteoglycan 6)